MRRLTTILIAGALLAPATLAGQGPPPAPRAGMGMGPRMAAGERGPQGGMFAPQMLLNHRRRLELTDPQATQLEALATEMRQAHDKADADAKPHEEKLQELWDADQPNVQAIQSEMQAVMQARHAAGLASAGAMARAKGLLTAEQRGRMEGWVAGRGMGSGRGGWDEGPRRGAGYRMHRPMRRF